MFRFRCPIRSPAMLTDVSRCFQYRIIVHLNITVWWFAVGMFRFRCPVRSPAMLTEVSCCLFSPFRIMLSQNFQIGHDCFHIIQNLSFTIGLPLDSVGVSPVRPWTVRAHKVGSFVTKSIPLSSQEIHRSMKLIIKSFYLPVSLVLSARISMIERMTMFGHGWSYDAVYGMDSQTFSARVVPGRNGAVC
jgi:hypothetical protein